MEILKTIKTNSKTNDYKNDNYVLCVPQIEILYFFMYTQYI